MFLLSFHDVSRPDSVLHQCLVDIAVAHMVETVQTHSRIQVFQVFIHIGFLFRPAWQMELHARCLKRLSADQLLQVLTEFCTFSKREDRFKG